MDISEMSSNERIKEHIESKIDPSIDGKIVLWGHKGLLDIEGSELFRAILQSVGQNELRDDGDLVGEFQIPETSQWYTAVLRTGPDDFISKYGSE